METKEIKFKLHYSGGEADNNRLDFYDASRSATGFARVLNITANSLIRESVYSKVANIKGANFYILPSRKGSFVQDVVAQFTPELVVGTVSLNILGNGVYDLLKCAVGNLINKSIDPQTAYVKDVLDRKEPFFDDLCRSLETPVVDMHATIQENEQLFISKARTNLITLDSGTKDYVGNEVVNREDRVISGNITRYNIITKVGRLFCAELGQTMWFDAKSLSKTKSHKISSLLHKANIDKDSSVQFVVNEVRTPKGVLKKYLIVDIKDGAENDNKSAA